MDCAAATINYKKIYSDLVASDLNRRFLEAVKTGDFYSDAIFDVGRVERGHSFPQYGKSNEGGIFWHRPQETPRENLDLGTIQFTGHSYDQLGVRQRIPNYVQTDVNRVGGGQGVYHDTPIIKPEMLTELIPIKSDLLETYVKYSPDKLLALREAAFWEAVGNAFLGWDGRMKAIQRRVWGSQILHEQVAKLDERLSILKYAKDEPTRIKRINELEAENIKLNNRINDSNRADIEIEINKNNTRINELKELIDPQEVKLETTELKSKKGNLTSTSFTEWVTGEGDFALLTELILGRRKTINIKKVKQSLEKMTDTEIQDKYGMSKDEIAKNADDAIKNRLSKDDLRPYLDDGMYPQVYMSYLEKALRVLGGAKYADKEPSIAEIRDEVARVADESKTIYDYEQTPYGYAYEPTIVEERIPEIRLQEERAIGVREGVTYETPAYQKEARIQEVREETPREEVVRRPEPYEPIVYEPKAYEPQPYKPTGYEPTPYKPTPYTPVPYEPPPYKPPPYTPKPYTPPPEKPRPEKAKVSYYEPFDKEKIMSVYKGVIAWKQGKLRQGKELREQWYVVSPPYETAQNVKRQFSRPRNAYVVSGLGSAYSTIQNLGANPVVFMAMDFGMFDLSLRTPTKTGEKGALKFQYDVGSRSRNPIRVQDIQTVSAIV